MKKNNMHITKITALILTALLLLPSFAEAVVSIGTTTTHVNTLSIPHTVPVGQDRLLVVGIAYNKWNGSEVSNITFNGQSFTKAVEQAATSHSGNFRSEIWYLVNPPELTSTITIGSNVPTHTLGVYVSDVIGVDQTAPLGGICWDQGQFRGDVACGIAVQGSEGIVFTDHFQNTSSCGIQATGSATEIMNIQPGVSVAGGSYQMHTGSTTVMSWGQVGECGQPTKVIVAAEFIASQGGSSSGPGKIVQNISYTYDNVGNITQITDTSDTGTAKTVTYTYDDLHRLVSAQTSSASSSPITQTYTYDAIGNILSRTGSGSFSYGAGSANPHAPTTIGGAAHTYDLNGNLLSNGAVSYTWDYNNRLMGSGGTTYAYDHKGLRVQKDARVYPNEHFNTDGTKAVKHIFLHEQVAGILETVGSTTEKQYIHTDHLSGANVATDQGGDVVEVLDYLPYGQERIALSSGFTAQRTFAGTEKDNESGLSYMKARYYDPKSTRFLSQDIVYQNLGVDERTKQVLLDPQLANSYSYARNNPLIMVDETGEFVDIVLDVGFIGFSAYKFTEAIFTGGNIGGEAMNLALDVGGAFVPIATGIGSAKRASNISRMGNAAANTVESASRFNSWLNKGEKNTYVYYGVRDGEKVYAGISRNLQKRALQHGDRFEKLIPISNQPLTRNQARSVEQYLIDSNPSFQNKINSINPNRDIYQSALDYGRNFVNNIE